MTAGKSKHIFHYTQADIDTMLAESGSANCNLTTEGWYFWDETEAYAHGPYASEEITEEKIAEYAKTI